MQRVGAVVGNEVVGLAIQCELRTADAVGIAAGDRAEMAGERLVLAQSSEAEHDVVEAARAVGHVDLGDDAAIAQKTHMQAVLVGHRVDVDRLPILRRAVRRMIERGSSVGRSARHHGRQCRSDRNGADHVCAEFAAEAKAYVAREIYHDNFAPFWPCGASAGAGAVLRPEPDAQRFRRRAERRGGDRTHRRPAAAPNPARAACWLTRSATCAIKISGSWDWLTRSAKKTARCRAFHRSPGVVDVGYFAVLISSTPAHCPAFLEQVVNYHCAAQHKEEADA